MKKDKKLHIVMAGGGTGGHVFPIQSLLQYIANTPKFSENIAKIYRLGTKNSLEQEICKTLIKTRNLPLEFITISSGKFRREKSFFAILRNIRDMFRFVYGCFQSLYFLLRHRVKVVFCKGGYVALPIVCTAWLMRKKIIVHESDTKPGLVNKIAAKLGDIAFTGFDKVLPHAMTVGQILSEVLISDGEIVKGLEKLKELDLKNKTNLLLIGGSQGAKTLYEAVLKAKPSSKYNILVVLGKENQKLREKFDKLPHTICFDFLSQEQMGTVLYHTDIAITRAGVTSLAEQKLFDIKSLIVPIPWTHDQSTNARYYVQKYGDVVLSQKSTHFVQEIHEFLETHQTFKKQRKVQDISEKIAFAKEKIIKTFFSEK